MAHHLDSPLARQDIRLDITDLYLFRGEVGTVFVINVCHSIFGEIPTPGYHPEGMYKFKIDLNGDAIEDVTYRITFDDRDAAARQRFVLRRITGADATDRMHPGPSYSGYHRRTATGANGVSLGRQGRQPVLDQARRFACRWPRVPGWHWDQFGWLGCKESRGICSPDILFTPLCLRCPMPSCSPGHIRPISKFGVWAVATLATDAGGWRPINRVGLPIIHPLFHAVQRRRRPRQPPQWRSARPTIWPRTRGGRKCDRRCRCGDRYIQDQLAYGRKVAHRFCPNILPYEVGTQATFGFAEWNGRSLTDNVPDVMFSLAANTPVQSWNWQRIGHQKTFAGLPICTFSGLTPTEAPGRPEQFVRPTCRRSLPTQTADLGYAVPGASAYFLGGAGASVKSHKRPAR